MNVFSSERHPATLRASDTPFSSEHAHAVQNEPGDAVDGVLFNVRKGTKILPVRDMSELCRSCVGIVSDLLKSWVFLNTCLQTTINTCLHIC